MRQSNYDRLFAIADNSPYSVYDRFEHIPDEDRIKIFDFALPIKDGYDIRGVFIIDRGDSRQMYISMHDKGLIACDFINDPELEKTILDVAEKTSEMTETDYKIHKPGLAHIVEDEDMSYIKKICPGFYAVHFDDGSMIMTNSLGQYLKTPLHNYDVIQELRSLGSLHGVPHFAYKACNWATQKEPEFGIFDLNGNEKYFKDPRLNYMESVDEIAAEFKKLVEISNDKNNPRCNDELLGNMNWKMNKSQKI